MTNAGQTKYNNTNISIHIKRPKQVNPIWHSIYSYAVGNSTIDLAEEGKTQYTYIYIYIYIYMY